MVFNSLTFLLFFLLVLLLHRLPLPWRVKKLNLLLASYLFYASWNPFYVLLVCISTCTDFWAAQRMARARGQGIFGRKGWLLLSLAANLGLLSYFKYAGFFLENFGACCRLLHLAYQPPAWNLVLPVAISFYTFQTLSYSIDVYRGKLKPWPSFLDYALFVTCFPMLLAGPITRAGYFLPQLTAPRQADSRQLGWGFSLLILGIFAKNILADYLLAPVVDQVFAGADRAQCLEAWVGALGFTAQIFFDFSGYSSCAIGVGLCLGLALPDNFHFPYAAIGFQDFWRRWHISLSTWLRDYLYVSLGGNRLGPGRTYLNLMATMLLGGLWHGASWNFVAWGGLHGAFLVLERFGRQVAGEARWAEGRIVRLGFGLSTFLLVSLAWIFFKASSFEQAFQLLGPMFLGGGEGLHLEPGRGLAVLLVTAALFGVHFGLRQTTLEQAAGRLPWWLRAAILAGMILALCFSPGDNRAFIYFKF